MRLVKNSKDSERGTEPQMERRITHTEGSIEDRHTGEMEEMMTENKIE